jgi:hypothetical protein
VEVLSAQADNSVTIAVIGYPMNIRDVLRHYPDLFESKVKEVFFMNGFYNFGCAEGHWLGPVGDCYDAADEMEKRFPHTVKQYFQGNGSSMCTGGDFFYDTCGSEDNPVKKAYSDWMHHAVDICWPARPSWDPLTVYAAIVGSSGALLTEQEGTDSIDFLGHEQFDTSKTSSNEVNLVYLDDASREQVTEIMNQYMCAGKKPSEHLQ